MTDRSPLETGAGSASPPGDNLLDDFVRESAESYAAFGRARGDRVERIDGVATMVDAGSPLPFVNRVVLERPVDDHGPLLARIRAFYDEGPPTPFLLDSAWPTPDLSTSGFTRLGHPPLMMRPHGDPFPPPPPELRIERVDDDRTAFDYERALIDGYPAPMLQPMTEVTIVTPPALDAPGWHHFVGYVDGEPVASGAGYAGDRLVRVDNIATLESRTRPRLRPGADRRGRGGRPDQARDPRRERSRPGGVRAPRLRLDAADQLLDRLASGESGPVRCRSSRRARSRSRWRRRRA